MDGALGCKLSLFDLRDYKVKAPSKTEFPEEFCLEKKTKIKNQGAVNSCVAHTFSTILEYFEDGKVDLSTNFIYGIQKKLYNEDGPGMSFAEACKIVKDYGDMTYKDCPGNDEIPTCYKIAEKAFDNVNKLLNAYRYGIDSYYRCDTVEDIKYALMTYGPVAIAIKWYKAYFVDISGVVQFNENVEFDYHAVTLIGWNKEGWICQNSWGENFSKLGGYFILPYRFGIKEARAIVDKPNEDAALHVPSQCFLVIHIKKVLNKIINLLLRK